MNKPVVAVTAVLGPLVLLSYVPIIRQSTGSPATLTEYWAGIPPAKRSPSYFAMASAAVGFLVWFAHYAKSRNAPKTGLLSRRKWILPALVAAAIGFSILWSGSVYMSVNRPSARAWRAVCSGSLVAVAIASLLLLAGTYEDDGASVLALSGIASFCICTVLMDGTAWNAKFILRSLSLRKRG